MSSGKIFLWIVATAAALFLATSGGRLYVSDSHQKLRTARSMVDHASTAVPPFGSLTVRSPSTGKTYAKFEVLHSVLMVPASLAGRGAVAAGMVPPERRIALEGLLASMESPLFAALGAGFLFLFLHNLSINRRPAILAAALLVAATMVWPYSKRSWTEMPQLTLLLATAWLLARSRRVPGRAPLIAAGACFGGVVALRVTGIVLLPLFLLFPLLPFPPRKTAAAKTALFLGGFAAVVAPLIAAVNLLQFGSLFSIYGWRSGGFTTSFLTGFRGFLISPGESIFLYSPVLLLAPFGARRLWRLDRGAFLLAFGIPLALICLYASWWFHAYTWGPRFLLPAVPFLLVPIALLRRAERRSIRLLVAAVVVLSVAIQAAGVAFHLGDLPRLAEPLIRAGFLPPDGELTRSDTWHHPLRTRLASHLLVLAESVPKTLGGKASSVPFDFWPATVRHTLGIPLRASLPVEAALAAFFLFGSLRLKQECDEPAAGGVSGA